MADIEVILVHPNGSEYDATIDEDADYDELLDGFIQGLELEESKYGYTFSIVGATGLQEGVRIKLEKNDGPTAVKSVRPRNSNYE